MALQESLPDGHTALSDRAGDGWGQARRVGWASTELGTDRMFLGRVNRRRIQSCLMCPCQLCLLCATLLQESLQPSSLGPFEG